MILGLGTAQFGSDYGLSNTSGRVSREEILRILEKARANSLVQVIDTAPAYGESEEILGDLLRSNDSFRIVTKTRLFKKKLIVSEDADLLMQDFENSLTRLKRKKLHGLLIHHADDLLIENGFLLFEALHKLKEMGLVDQIGVSVYTTDQITEILKRFTIYLIELPFNVFDQQLLENGFLNRLKKNGVEIYARSIFLQGLLLMNPDHLPEYFDPIRNLLLRYHSELKKYGLSPLEGALQFVNSLDLFNCVVVGVCSEEQLTQVIEAAHKVVHKNFPFRSFSYHNPNILNPALWKLDRVDLT